MKLGKTLGVAAAAAACGGLLAACSQAETPSAAPRTVNVYLMAGASNMAGFGVVDSLPERYRSAQSDVYIFHGDVGADDAPESGVGVWAPLQPGHGTGFEASTGVNSYAEMYGPELSFGARMAELNPGRDIAIIKYVRNGSALQIGAAPGGTWDPDSNFGNGVNQYDHLLATLRNALADTDVNGDGVEDTLVPSGIIWFQGEGDASHIEATAASFEPKLKRIVDLMRAAFRIDDLPVVIGQISDSGMDDKDGKVMNHVDLVRDAQARFVESDANAVLAKTDGLPFRSDGWHFNSEAMLQLGVLFAESAHELQSANTDD